MCQKVPDISAGETACWHIWHLGTRYILNLIKRRRINNSSDTRAREVPRVWNGGTAMGAALAVGICVLGVIAALAAKLWKDG